MLMRSSDTGGTFYVVREGRWPQGLKGLLENRETRLSGWTSWESLPRDTQDRVLSILRAHKAV